ncbi:hypothetical protein SEA_CEPENS_81 [Mycobacterium phage Cepens]|nr:hypothetical protein SEA_CEPENS_81 [Mycobacterium phage Cepens]
MWIGIVYRADINEIDWHVGLTMTEVEDWVLDNYLPKDAPPLESPEQGFDLIAAEGDKVVIEAVEKYVTSVQYSVRLPNGSHTGRSTLFQGAVDLAREQNSRLRAAGSNEVCEVVQRGVMYTQWKVADA